MCNLGFQSFRAPSLLSDSSVLYQRPTWSLLRFQPALLFYNTFHMALLQPFAKMFSALHILFPLSPLQVPPTPPSHPLNWHRQSCNSNPFTVMGMWVGYTGTELTLQGFTARRNHRARPPYFTHIFIDLSDSKGPLVYGGDEEERRAGCREVKRRWKQHREGAMLRSCQAGSSVNMSQKGKKHQHVARVFFFSCVGFNNFIMSVKKCLHVEKIIIIQVLAAIIVLKVSKVITMQHGSIQRVFIPDSLS